MNKLRAMLFLLIELRAQREVEQVTNQLHHALHIYPIVIRRGFRPIFAVESTVVAGGGSDGGGNAGTDNAAFSALKRTVV